MNSKGTKIYNLWEEILPDTLDLDGITIDSFKEIIFGK